jgi:hypothetical protein
MSRQQRRKIQMQQYKKDKKARRAAQKELKEKEGLVTAQEALNNAKSKFTSPEEEKAEEQRVAIDYLKTMQRVLPGLLERLADVEDFRNPKKIKHKVAVILLFAILWFVFQKSSRREANRQMTTPTFLQNMRLFFPDLDSVPHHDTVNRFLSGVDINELDNVLVDLIRHFIRSKKFVTYLINNCYPVAIDGTQKFVYEFLWAEECQQRKAGDKTQYYCSYLEASLVFHNGIILPLASEPLNYMQGDVSSDKQDCETKAFHRLAEKIKHFFPKLKIMVILDGLYPNGPIFERCREYGWQFMIVLKDDSLKSVWEEFFALQKFEGKKKVKMRWANRDQEFTWVNEICYTYDNDKKEQTIHVVVCEEQWREIGKDASIEHKHSKHAWISSHPLTSRNLHERCNLGARHRWNIENGFLIEKQYGYHYEHTFSFNWNAMRGFHILMRIGHMINTLARYGNLLRIVFTQKGMMATIKYLDEIFRKNVLDHFLVMKCLAKPCQIRFT